MTYTDDVDANKKDFVQFSVIPSILFFIWGIQMFSKVKTAKIGNFLCALGMAIAIVLTLLTSDVVLNWEPILVTMVVGALIGTALTIPATMEHMPELVALYNAFGGLSSCLEAFATTGGTIIFTTAAGVTFVREDYFTRVITVLGGFIGVLTFTGSLVGACKLQGLVNFEPMLRMLGLRKKGDPANYISTIPRWICNAVFILLGLAGMAIYLAFNEQWVLWASIGFATLIGGVFGIVAVASIGGADMPVVISILNSFSGWAGCLTGFMVKNELLVMSGTIVGASGWMLSIVMCRGMNRTLGNVIFGNWVNKKAKIAAGEKKDPKTTTAKDTAKAFREAKSVLIVPGYGMAAAKAQFGVAKMTKTLRAHGVNVRFAVHPVAGRLPGHMNVLLAEAKVPYDIVMDYDVVKDDFDHTDVCFVLGANDTVNPGAVEDPSCSLYGMPVFTVWKCKTVIMNKRSLGAGYAGVDNPLFVRDNTLMLLGGADKAVDAINQDLDAFYAEQQTGDHTAVNIEMSTVVKAVKVEEKVETYPEARLSLAVLKESEEDEFRVAITPDVVKELRKKGFDVVVVKGAGLPALFLDDMYAKVGAIMVDTAEEAIKKANCIAKINKFTDEEVALLEPGKVVISFMQPNQSRPFLEALAQKNVVGVAMDAVPRTTKAQKLDALSSMGALMGYRAVIECASRFGGTFAPSSTAAGSIPPAKMLVIGCGVAGLAAAGAAHSMGAIVRAFDTRSAAREQAESMGAEFLEVNIQEDGEGGGGYAKTMSPAFVAAEMKLFMEQCEEVDLVITTAQIPGRTAPRLLTKEHVMAMRPGSVIVDLAASSGGNCELTKPGEVIKTENLVTIVGTRNLATYMAPTASRQYAKNISNLLDEIYGATGTQVNFQNDVIEPMYVTMDAKVTFDQMKVLAIQPTPIVEVSTVEIDRKESMIRKQKEKAKRDEIMAWIKPLIVGLILYVVGLALDNELYHLFLVFTLAVIAGWNIVWQVAPALQTPLMSVTNAISGIVVVAAILEHTHDIFSVSDVIGSAACLVATINVVGGFSITHKMLCMFVTEKNN